MEVKNSDIRGHAWFLCKHNYKKLLIVTLLISIFLVIGDMAGTVASLLISLVFSPIINVGMIRFVRKLWHGEDAGPADLVAYPSYTLRIWGIAIPVNLLTSGLSILASMMIAYATTLSYVSSTVYLVVLLVFGLLMIVLTYWLTIRLSLAYTAFVLNPDTRAFDCIKASWRATRGHFWRVFCNMIVLMLPLYICTFILTYAFNLTGILYAIFYLLVETLLEGYIYLGEYGLAELLLTGHVDIPRKPESDDRPEHQALPK